MLLADTLDRAGLDACQRAAHLADQRSQILHPIRPRTNDDQPEGQGADIVLVFELAIHRQKRVSLAGGSAE
jgi:hypothetical protein